MPKRAPRPAAVDLAVVPDAPPGPAPVSPSLLHALDLLPASVLPDGAERDGSRGRPTKYTRRHVLRLLEALCDGHYLVHAAQLAGLSDTLVSEWVNADRDGDSRFLGFVEAYRAAEAFAIDRNLKDWQMHNTKDFRAPRDFLARRAKAQWAPESHVITEGQAPQVHIAVVQPSDLLPMLGVLQQAGALPSGEAIAQSMDMIEGEVITPGTGHAERHQDASEPADEY